MVAEKTNAQAAPKKEKPKSEQGPVVAVQKIVPPVQEKFAASSDTIKENWLNSRNDGPQVSISFIYNLSNMINWPLAAFGLFVDNALITKSQNLRINYLQKQKTKPKRPNQNPMEAETKNGDEGQISYFLIEDDGQGWKSKEFLNILMNYDTVPFDPFAELGNDDDKIYRLNEYGLNLKIGGFRLGKSIIFVTKDEDDISIGFISVDKRFNPNIHANHVFFASWNKKTGEFLTPHGQKNKNLILNALNGTLSEEEILKGMDKVSNRIFLLNLNTILTSGGPSADAYELILGKHGGNPDIHVRSLDHRLRPLFENSTQHSLLELSLRTYLGHLFLEPKGEINVFLNDSKIQMRSLKEAVAKCDQGLVKNIGES